jgi:nitroimidazol reductase NimA-like FMN-containing flavoprotein (pyridoxamine 5'-phosphate oxidase superfamily)
MPTNAYSFDEWSPQGPVTELSDAAAWDLLNAASFGRLGVSLNNRPEIFPVNYHADGTSILFRTAKGTKLHELIENSHVVFEVDAQQVGDAWSVTAKGTAEVLDEPDAVEAADQRPLPDWIPTAAFVYVKVSVDSIRGRRFSRKVTIERAADLTESRTK